MKNTVYILFVLLFGLTAKAQVDSPTSYSSYFTLSASRYEPGNLGEDHERFEIALINLYGWLGNTSLNGQSLTDLTKHMGLGISENEKSQYRLSEDEIHTILDKMGEKNRLGIGATVDYLNMMYKITNSEGDEILTVGVGLADRFEANLVFPNNLFRLAVDGNKQYAGQSVALPLKGGAFYAREYTLCTAIPIPIESEDWHFRLGTRLKYIQGIEALYTERGDYSLYTDTKAKYLDLNYDYALHSSFDYRSGGDYSFSPNNTKGKGFGADLGVSATFKKRWHGNINFLDLGSVTFDTPDNLTYKKTGKFRYEGLYFDDLIDENSLNTDSVIEAIQNELTDGNEYEGEKFTMPYPARLRMHLSYRVPAENKKGHTYYPHIIGLNFTQGFRDLGSATTRTYLAGSYTFNLHDSFEVGTNLGVLGYNKFEFGAFIGFKAGFFRMGLGSGNLTALINKSMGTGADINFNMTFAFN